MNTNTTPIKLIMPRTVYNGDGSPEDMSALIAQYHVGGHFCTDDAAPGTARRVYEVTSIDERGLSGRLIRR